MHLIAILGRLEDCPAFSGTLMHSITPAMVLDEFSGDMKLTFVCKDVQVRREHEPSCMESIKLPSKAGRQPPGLSDRPPYRSNF